MRAKTVWFWIKTILIALFAAWFVRTFFIESYSIPACSMENTLLAKDRIFVNKVAYGIRLPMTILSIPFCHDSLFGIKSYSSSPRLPYKRLFGESPERNDVVVFNNPTKNPGIPIDKQKVSIGRCVALPGDTLAFKDKIAYINGREVAQSPNIVEPYYYSNRYESQIAEKMCSLRIPNRGLTSVDNVNIRFLSRYETFLMQQQLPDSVIVEVLRPTYSLIIPAKGTKIKITEENYHIYLPLIALIEGKSVTFQNDIFRIDENRVDFYEFTLNYYWMLPDNRSNCFEITETAFIPETHIIGKALYIWNRGFQKIR